MVIQQQKFHLLGHPMICAIALILCTSVEAYAGNITIDFEADNGGTDIVHGQIIDDEFTPPLSVSALNLSAGPHLAIIFDSTVPYSPSLPLGPGNEGKADPDLLGPRFVGDTASLRQWSTGNLAPGTLLGNLLIIAEHPSRNSGTPPDADGDGIIDVFPDDEGSRPAGKITFDFSTPITAFGTDLVDIEASGEFSGGFFAAFFSDGTQIGSDIGFEAFVDNSKLGGHFFDSTITFGDHSANHLEPITVADLNTAFGTSATSFDKVVVGLGGSGALTNVFYSTPEDPNDPVIPEPSSIVLLATSSFGFLFAGLRKRRRKNC